MGAATSKAGGNYCATRSRIGLIDGEMGGIIVL